MTLRSYVEWALGLFLVIIVLALLLGQLLGQPILLGFVSTGSMEPTMNAGDGFVAVPSLLAGDTSEGDVVVFEAEELHGGGLTTHRVVGETDEGYITRGDANPFTDQDGDEPPVSDGQIVAHALQVGDTVVTIPHLGTVVMGFQSGADSAQQSVVSAMGGEGGLERAQLGGAFVGLGLFFIGLAVLTGSRNARDLTRSSSRPDVVKIWVVGGAVLVVLVVAATAAMVVPAGIQEYGVASSETPEDDPLVIEAGGSSTVEHTVRNDGFVPVVVFFDPGEDVTTDPDRTWVSRGATAETSVTLSVPEEEGRYTRHVTEHRYLVVLPPGLIGALHSIHPLVALLSINAVIAVGGLAAIVALFGTGDIRLRSGKDVPLAYRLRRKLRKWL